MSERKLMDTQEALDYLDAHIDPGDIDARLALSALVVKISLAADALAEVNEIAQGLVDALQEHFGPKPEGLSGPEWIATLASNQDSAPAKTRPTPPADPFTDPMTEFHS